MIFRLNILPCFFVIILCGLLSFFWLSNHNGIFNSDNYLSHTYNLIFNKTYSGATKYSGSETESVEPTWRRAPGFPFLMTAVFLVSSQKDNLDRCFNEIINESCDQLFFYVKFTNCILFVICILYLFFSCYLCYPNRWLAFSVSCIVAIILSKEMTVSSHSEPLAITCYSAVCFYFLKWIAKGKNPYLNSTLAALFLSILILTRPVFLYYIPIFIFLFILIYIRKNEHVRNKLKSLLSFSLLMVLFITPWMTRNHYYFKEIDIANSGSVQVLSIRSEFNKMSNREYLAGFIYWLPIPILGNKLQKSLNSDVYQKFKVDNEFGFRQAGYYHGKQLVDSLGYKKAKSTYFRKILYSPITNIKMSLLFAWRGVHYAFLFAPFFIILVYMSVRYEKYNHFFLIFSISLFNLLFHAFITHFNIRYGYPLVIGFAPTFCIVCYLFKRKLL